MLRSSWRHGPSAGSPKWVWPGRGGDGTGKGREEVAQLTKALIAEGIDYTGIDVRESSLEDIFVSLLGEEEGQAA